MDTQNCFSQWVQQQSGVSTPLYNVQFVNRYTGWATGSNSVILKTSNGGINWLLQPIDLGYPKNLYGLSMVNENIGYIAGWFETILKTTNGGINWVIISNIPSNNGNSNHGVSFINSETGWVCSSLGRVLRTTNGGLSWDTANVGNTGPLRDIQFVNSNTGWVCGDGGNVRRTTNGGVNWIFNGFLTGSNILSLYFINSDTGWAVSEQQNQVFRTTNAGVRWDTIAILPGGSLQYSYTIYFSSPNTGWIGGTNSRLFKTINGGFNWVRENANFPAFFWNFSFYNDSVGWCVGGQGTIIHTTTSGEPLGITKIGESTPKDFRL
ncbi:MAG: YCF48-related protein, partial [Ignavibacteria bacterium]